MEQRKFVVPEVVVGKNVMELIGRYLGHFGSRKTMIVTDKNILKLNWFQNIINNLMKKYIEYIIFQHGNDHSITIEKEIKKQKTASKNQLSILDEINKNL